jgi:ribonuclease HII
MMKRFLGEELLKGHTKIVKALEFDEEDMAEAQGFALVAGVDEVGRGCLAGPLVASAVIVSKERDGEWLKIVRDSKVLSPRQREYLVPFIYQAAVSVGTGVVSPRLIDSIGMTGAVISAMKAAINNLMPTPDYLLIDYLTLPDMSISQKGIVDGDAVCFSIACASIVAKVYRDRLMVELDRKYPGYGFARHKGYGTREHLNGLKKFGPCPLHRRLFQPVRNLNQLSFDDLLNKETGLLDG